MAFKRILTAATAAALIFSPATAVAARAASPAPIGAQQLVPADETIDEGSELRRTGFIIPLVGIVLVVLAVLLLTKNDDKDPVSP